jgi:hypothetical protein
MDVDISQVQIRKENSVELLYTVYILDSQRSAPETLHCYCIFIQHMLNNAAFFLPKLNSSPIIPPNPLYRGCGN